MAHTIDLRSNNRPGAVPELLTTKQVARVLGVSASFLERDRCEGARIPFVKVGARAVRYDPLALARYLHEQTRTSTSQQKRKTKS